MSENSVLIFQQDQAESLLNSPSFLKDWDLLLRECPWATVFQNRVFVRTWYESFSSYPKIIVCDWNGEQMKGILTLTLKGGQLTGAGLDLAEYQAWLSREEDSEDFLKAAFRSLQKEFPKTGLYLKYLNNRVPINSFQKNGFLRSNAVMRAYEHPLMETDVEVLDAELKKKNKKEKINRLKRLGELEFFEIEEKVEFLSLIDEMALQSDFRKGAFYNKTFFYDEPERKDFLLKLFDQGCLHVSGLKVGGEMIASNAGIMGTDVVHLQGINCHSPYYSKYSPGILQFLMLGIALKKSGFRYFDLTPGGADGYKSSLATESSTAYELWVLPAADAKKKRLSETLRDKVKPHLKGKRFLGEDLSNFFMVVLKIKLKLKFIPKKLNPFARKDYFHFLETDADLSPWTEIGKSQSLDLKGKTQFHFLQKDCIQDLLLFDESRSIRPRMDFLADCITRIEYGQVMYTLSVESRLLGVFWFIPSSAKNSKLRKEEDKRKELLTCSYFNTDTEIRPLDIFTEILNGIEAVKTTKDGIWIEYGKGLLKS